MVDVQCSSHDVEIINQRCIDIIFELQAEGRFFISSDIVLYALLTRYNVNKLDELHISSMSSIPVLFLLSSIHNQVKSITFNMNINEAFHSNLVILMLEY